MAVSRAAGSSAVEALNSGYHLAFTAGAGFAILAAILGFVMFGKESTAVTAQAGLGGHGL